MKGAIGWRAAILCAVFWGVGVTLADTLTQPVVGITFGQWLYFSLELMWQWTLSGLVWALGAKLLARGHWAFAKTAILLPLSFIVTIAAQWISPFPDGDGASAISTPFVGVIPIFDVAVYLLWMNAFYGGLYIVGYMATLRTARARRRLTEFRLARNEADLLLREARVSAFRGQLQPSMLLTAIAGLRERYARNPNEGDQLFDHLISFLRAAMPSVRSGFSTLGAELETVQSYASLRASLGINVPRWHLDVPKILPALPFPSLILLPALDSLGATLGALDLLSLTVTVDAGEVVLSFDASQPIQLSSEIKRRLHGGLRLTFGRAAKISEGRDLPIFIRLLPQPLDTRSSAYPEGISEGGIDETDRSNDDCGNAFAVHRDQ